MKQEHTQCPGRNTELRRAAARNRGQGPTIREYTMETWSLVQVVPCNILDLIFVMMNLYIMMFDLLLLDSLLAVGHCSHVDFAGCGIA